MREPQRIQTDPVFYCRPEDISDSLIIPHTLQLEPIKNMAAFFWVPGIFVKMLTVTLHEIMILYSIKQED